MSDFEAAWKLYRARAERALAARLPAVAATDSAASLSAAKAPPQLTPPRLGEAIRYVCLNGGKRFRAMLVYACGELAGAALEQLDAAAAAVEMMHAYSLVHDDLPAMDDDDIRRGRKTCHIAYDQATAILTGDALQAMAFETLGVDSALRVTPKRRVRMLATLADAVGARGMVGGQALDMEAVGAARSPAQPGIEQLSLAQLSRMHRMKTGALIRAAACLGCLTAPRVDEKLLQALAEYATGLGLAFQIVDDILDVEASSETLGKAGGVDRRMQKTTYVSLLGVAKAREEARRECQNARQIAVALGDNTQFLQQLAHFVEKRNF